MATGTDSAHSEIPQDKTCTKCGETKPLSEFYARKLGRRADCKKCCDARRLLLAASNRDAENESRRAWKIANPEKVRDSNKRYRSENKDSIGAYNKAYRLANPEAHEASTKKWRNANRPAYLAQARGAAARRLATDKGRLESVVKAGIQRGVASGTKAGRKTFDLLGYTADELKLHIEKQFIDGMSWSNYGKFTWHIDHIRPLNSFAYSTPDDDEFKQAWALSNLQPLWAVDNWSKGARYNPQEKVLHDET